VNGFDTGNGVTLKAGSVFALKAGQSYSFGRRAKRRLSRSFSPDLQAFC
jgi:hypothetical protein